jgi:bifunctional DNase/RNase
MLHKHIYEDNLFKYYLNYRENLRQLIFQILLVAQKEPTAQKHKTGLTFPHPFMHDLTILAFIAAGNFTSIKFVKGKGVRTILPF